MTKALNFIQVCPGDPMFWWQTAVQLYNFRRFGYDKKATVLIFLTKDKINTGVEEQWMRIKEKFPDTQMYFFQDRENLLRTMQKVDYLPLVRPYCLEKHFRNCPWLKDEAIFYHDSDILFSKELEIDKYLEDDVNYLSYTGRRETQYNYQCYDHFHDKEKNIKDELLDEYLRLDPIKKVLSTFGITVQDFIARKGQVGGAQYLLKNIDYHFWQEVFTECINVRSYLQRINQHFMKGETRKEREDNGFQSWATDMWVIQWLLWKHGKTTICPPEMDFSWASDEIERWEKCPIYHDAGGNTDENSDKIGKYRLFHKRGVDGEYTRDWRDLLLRIPFSQKLDFVSNRHCSINYVKELKEAQEFLNL